MEYNSTMAVPETSPNCHRCNKEVIFKVLLSRFCIAREQKKSIFKNEILQKSVQTVQTAANKYIIY